ncbi:33 kDa ribonucleoprotein, chloroplastic-like isoform X2 [Vicia villosa]|uniref:33 kDa ribonucleoprotein, chloroplastic-like isoform X2 n=1 Tax=Vicia villosa TaxID=3911 RepID=UPI00273B5CF1|nr:33 kDa ribonucleoprotein, chloroplastic-like isoform X2 [Vicia villosa]
MASTTPSVSSYIPNRIYNLSFTHSSISLTTNFPQRPISHKPLNLILKSQSFTLSPLTLQPPFAAADGFETTQDTTVSQLEEQKPETETEKEQETSDEQQKEEEQKVSASDDAGRLYVGNLPFSITSSQLSEIFAEAGTVVSVEMVYQRLTARSRGFAFVTMKSVEEAEAAIQMFDGSQIGGRSAKVNFPEVPRGGETLVMEKKNRNSNRGFVDSPHKIYAGNLGWALNSQDLRDAFAEQPGLLGARINYEKGTGRSRGFGFVTFETAEDLQAAMNAMNGVEVQGRPLRLNLATERKSYSRPPVIEKSTETKSSPPPPVIEESTETESSPPPPVNEESSASNVDNSELVSSASA